MTADAPAEEPRPELSVVVPCLNEEATVVALLERIDASLSDAGLSYEVVFVDDGSTDSTWERLTELAASSPEGRVTIERHAENQGIPNAWNTGVARACGSYVVLIDADLQNSPADIPRLYAALQESHADVVQGYRSHIERQDGFRLFSSKVLNWLLNVSFGDHAKDNKSGFVLAPRLVMLEILHHERRYHHFQTFIRVAARARGYTVTEIETLFFPRYAGTSFLAGSNMAKVTFQALLDIPVALREFGRGRGRPRDGSVVPTRQPLPKATHPYRGWRRVLFELFFATMPLHKWLIRRNARALYLQLKQTEYLPADQMRELQTEKLRRMLQHSARHVPYYRTLFASVGFDPSTLSSLDDLERVPLLGKPQLRRHLYFDLFADDHVKSRMHKISTSGSTGEPTTTYADRYQLEVRFATTLRALEWTGWRFGDRQARLWHQTLGMSRSQVIRERIDAMFMRRLFIPAFELNPANLQRMIDRIRRHRPVLVDGYAESLNFLASYVRAGNRPGFSPRSMMSSAQALPDNVRDDIEAGFGTRVYDKYGSREFSGIAYQCEASRDHHVMSESYILEILVEGRRALPGEVGEIVITDLNNFSTPLIRYRLGDLATAVDESEPCPCGRSMPRIGRIEGRTQAIVHCANGTWMPGTFFAHFFKDYEHLIRFFQIHQSTAGSFVLKVVRGDQWGESTFAEMLLRLRKYVGETEITVEYVDSIPLLRTGKRSPVVSSVGLDFQAVDQTALGAR
ncbi:glycosyltransferase [Protaetiibacter intestinalis]|uniref:Glycosyltransferase n=1 Tax=Protaetiibacter intestinalis TaxID=2419774 RepID=A0A387B7M2_9MICO|nr:glycosyltransferase [Protaetiibacter intestinalis]AYF98343.1 glycosyltransferase [Protaetiibacter intestinalis]